MRKVALLVAIGALAAGIPTADGAAARTRVQTELVVLEAASVNGNLVAFGTLGTTRKCRAHRTLVLLSRKAAGEPFRVIDTGQSSRHGAWGLLGTPLGSNDDIKVRVKPRKLRNGNRCLGDQALLVD